MPKIRFLHTRVVQDQHVGTPLQTRYVAGEVYDLPLASCNRWVQRGLAERVAEVVVRTASLSDFEVVVDLAADDGALAPAAHDSGPVSTDPAPDTVAIPADWRDLTWQQQRSLAAKLTRDPVRNKAAAVAAIEAELARRAPPSEEAPAGDA